MPSVRMLIIGSGPAGYTAAIYAARAALSPVLMTGSSLGGQLLQTTEVENFPGFPDGITGFDLMENMKKQALRFGVKIVQETVHRIDISGYPFVCQADTDTYQADSVIVATGATAKWLNIPGENEYKGYGVSGCATCDGFFYRGKEVVVIGGGNTALSDALYLANHASKVTLIHRRESFRGEKILVERVRATPNIQLQLNSVVKEIVGELSPRCVTHVRIENLLTKQETLFPTDGVFVAIGHAPQTSFLQGIALDEAGYIVRKNESMQTSVPGIFAAGDCADPYYQQAITAAAMGCQAVIEAEDFLQSLK